MRNRGSKQNFLQAARDDEYAEYELDIGFTLCTDWQGDGAFLPWVEPGKEIPEKHREEVMHDVYKEITNIFDCTIAHMHYDERQDIIYPEHIKMDDDKIDSIRGTL